MADRYPYQLVGLVTCKTCGDRMVGKSAHGRSEKIGYYEHSWATKKGAAIPGLKHQCSPYRVLAKLLEPALWQEVVNLLENEGIARELLNLAKKNHLFNKNSKEVEKHNQTIYGVDKQLEMLAERLATLPQSISPTPIYKQMEKLEGHKKYATEALAKLRSAGVVKDEPAVLKDYSIFLTMLREILTSSDSFGSRVKIIRALVQKILITPEGFEVYFKVGDSHVRIFMNEFEKNGDRRASNSGQKNRAEDLSDP